MPRNILCFIICLLLCIMLAGCSDGSDSESGNAIPSITTTLGENPTITFDIGESQTVAFRVVTDEPVFQSDFAVALSNTEIADVEYLRFSDGFVYYSIKAKKQGTIDLCLEIPTLDLKSETVKIKVTETIPNNIYVSLGEAPEISIAKEESKTVCFRVGENISQEALMPVIADRDIVKAEFERRYGAYFYYKITGLSKGSTTLYLEMSEYGVCSETITLYVVENSSSLGPDETTAAYIGNSESKKFHKPTCGSAQTMNSENKVVFDIGTDRQTVIDMGYSPCGNCNP